jgi:hypothetical protein
MLGGNELNGPDGSTLSELALVLESLVAVTFRGIAEKLANDGLELKGGEGRGETTGPPKAASSSEESTIFGDCKGDGCSEATCEEVCSSVVKGGSKGVTARALSRSILSMVSGWSSSMVIEVTT